MIANRLRGLANMHVGATAIAAASFMLAYSRVIRRLHFIKVEPTVNFTPYVLCVIGGMLASARFIKPMSGNLHRLTWEDAARLTVRQVAVVALFVFAFMFAIKGQIMSRLFMGTYLVLVACLLLFVNLGFARLASRVLFGRGRRIPTLFIGSPKSLERFRQWLAGKQGLGLEPIGFLSDELVPDERSMAAPFLGKLSDLPKAIVGGEVIQVVVLEIPRTTGEARFIIETCQDYGCRLLFHSNLAEQLQHPITPVVEDGHEFYSLQREPLEDPLNRIIKRTFDIIIALPVATLLLPGLIVLVWMMQHLQAPGRLFFRQIRTGHGQKLFRIIKFRSMYDRAQTRNSETRQASRNDDRIYPFGRILRSTSIDEFPQFINVLRGEMSIVGPRPHLVEHDLHFSQMTRGYRTRFFVKPGITGLAQSRGLRGEISDPKLLEQRTALDLVYITQWSIWLDFQIVVRTAWQIIFPARTAY